MASTNQIKLTIGGPETVPGQAASRSFVIPLRAVSDLDRKAEKGEDPAIIGRNMASGEYLISEDVSGNIPLTPRPCGGFGKLLKSCLGKELPPLQVAGCIRLRYEGSEESCLLTGDNGENSLASSLGDKGSEVPDPFFGTDGVIHFEDPAFDTIAKAVTVINGYAGYSCEKVFGADEEDLTQSGIEHFSVLQGNQLWAYIWFFSSDTGVYRHTFYYDLSADELPTFSVQKDGYMDNYLYTGCVVNSLRLSAALKGFLEGEAEIVGFAEIPGQSVSDLALEDVDPLIFHKGSFSLGGKDFNFIRSLDIEFGNNHNTEGYGQGSASRQYHEKGKFESSGSCSIRMDTDSHALRELVFSGALISSSFIFRGKEIIPSIPELMIVEVPYCALSSYEYEENSGVFDSGISFRVLYPKGVIYNNPVRITILTTDSEEY